MFATTLGSRSMRPAAAVLFGCLTLQFLASMHHPFVKASSAKGTLAQISSFGATDALFHTLMIALALAIFYALSVYASRTPVRGELTIFGLIVAAAATIAIVFAGLTDGFFIPMFSSAAIDGHISMPAAQAILRAAGLAIQVLSKFGFTAYGLCATLWGVRLIMRDGARLQGAVLAAAGVALGLVVVSMHAITPLNLAFVALFNAVWMIVLGAYMWRTVV